MTASGCKQGHINRYASQVHKEADHRIAADEAQEAAFDMGFIKPKVEDYVSDEPEPGADQSPEDDPNAAFPKL